MPKTGYFAIAKIGDFAYGILGAHFGHFGPPVGGLFGETLIKSLRFGHLLDSPVLRFWRIFELASRK